MLSARVTQRPWLLAAICAMRTCLFPVALQLGMQQEHCRAAMLPCQCSRTAVSSAAPLTGNTESRNMLRCRGARAAAASLRATVREALASATGEAHTRFKKPKERIRDMLEVHSQTRVEARIEPESNSALKPRCCPSCQNWSMPASPRLGASAACLHLCAVFV